MLGLRGARRQEAAAHRRRAPRPARHHGAVPRAVTSPRNGRARRADADHQRLAARRALPPSSPPAASSASTCRSTRWMPNKFRAITRWGDLAKVMAGIDAAQAAGLHVKINAVALKGVNEDEIPALMEWAHGRGMDLSLIEVMPLGDIEQRARRPVSAACRSCGRGSAQRYTLDDDRSPHRRPGALRARQGDRRPARLHHAAHPQFLRRLQPRARHLHRHALSCASARTMPPTCARRCARRRPNDLLHAAIERAIARKPKGHDFVIDRRTKRPALARHMSMTGG